MYVTSHYEKLVAFYSQYIFHILWHIIDQQYSEQNETAVPCMYVCSHHRTESDKLNV